MEAEFRMLIVETIAKIRRAYFVQRRSIKSQRTSYSHPHSPRFQNIMIQAGPSSWDRRDDVKGNREPYYTDAHNFEPIEAARAREKADQDEYWFANRYSFEWEDFCAQVQFSSRFFGIKRD
jgi:hypothetical protein